MAGAEPALNTRFKFLIAVCLALGQPAWCGHTLTPQQQKVLQSWLVHHTEYHPAGDEDCQCPEDIEEMRTQSVGVWKPVPDYHPYIATGDFNGDGTEDFAVVVVNRSGREGSYALLVFNGPFNSDLASPVFMQPHLSLKYHGLFYGPPRAKPYRLVVGRFDSDSGAILVPHGNGYRLMVAGEEAGPGSVDTPEKEELRLAYELILTKCRGTACHDDPAAKGETQISLDREESELYGWTFVEKQAGDLEYQLRFFAGHELEKKVYGRGIRIGFAGRTRGADSKQVTWAEKRFDARNWRLFPTMSVAGTPYSEGQEKITPTLHVSFLKVVQDLTPPLPTKRELQLGYELTLTRCKGNSCHSDAAKKGQVRLSLYYLDPTASWGVATATENAGNVKYEVRISGESEPREKGFERTLTIGFSGRMEKLSDKRVTWAAKSFKAPEWRALPKMSVSGDPYTEGDERVTPTLLVNLVNER